MTPLKLLYVDDDPDIREVAEISLSMDTSIEVRTAGSGREALEVLATWRPDGVLLDVMMPEMDGPATLRALRDDDDLARLPVIFVTARAMQEEIASLRALGAAGVVTKPFAPASIAAEVRGILGA